MPSPAFTYTVTAPINGLTAITVYWCGKVATASPDGIIWSIGDGVNANTISLVNDAANHRFNILTLDAIASGNQKSVDPVLDENICIAMVIDTSLSGADEIEGYLNGSSSGWTDTGASQEMGAFTDAVPYLGDINGASPDINMQAFAIFPVAHTQAQIQAVSDSWLAMADGH